MRVDTSLWAFSVSVYGLPGVAEECLSLQDRFGINVNILLFCIYAASEFGTALSQEDISAADRAITGWQTQVVKALRELRRLLKKFTATSECPHASSIESLRTQIANAELESERIEAIMLTEWYQAQLSDRPRCEPDTAIVQNCQSVLSYYCVGQQIELPQRLIELARSGKHSE